MKALKIELEPESEQLKKEYIDANEDLDRLETIQDWQILDIQDWVKDGQKYFMEDEFGGGDGN